MSWNNVGACLPPSVAAIQSTRGAMPDTARFSDGTVTKRVQWRRR